MKLFRKKPRRGPRKEKKGLLEVLAPHQGHIKNLAEVEDEGFAKKLMGDGLAINPLRQAKQIEVLAPISGKLVTVFPTNHAFGIKSKGKEVLLHIGIDTVNLKGKGFKVHVSQGQVVKAGAKLVTVDLNFLRKNAAGVETMIIVPSGEEIKKPASGKIAAQATLFKV